MNDEKAFKIEGNNEIQLMNANVNEQKIQTRRDYDSLQMSCIEEEKD